MTMKTLAEKIAVMQAALNGTVIEYQIIGEGIWRSCGNPMYNENISFNWNSMDYRIAPKPKLRPFTRADMTDEVRWVRLEHDDAPVMVTSVFTNGIARAAGTLFMFDDLAKMKSEWSPSMNGPWHPFTVEEK